MNSSTTLQYFLEEARRFVEISDKIGDGWKLHVNDAEIHKTHISKDAFLEQNNGASTMLFKVRYIIFYNRSYGVPSFSFNVWNSSGVLITLEDLWMMSFVRMSQKEFYSVITQQEHPIFFRPYFIMHPCHTDTLLTLFKDKSKNIIVTFLGLITPLIQLNLPMEYGL